MDTFTRQHLDAWLDTAYPNDRERVRARKRIRVLFESDPEYWSNAGWPATDRAAREAEDGVRP